MLDEGTLVLEGVTLAQVVELVVQVLVDLAGGTVADEQATENTHAAHPEDLALIRYPSAHIRFIISPSQMISRCVVGDRENPCNGSQG